MAQLVGLIGWPVAHSLSPRMQNAAFAAAGLDWVYVPLPTPPERIDEAGKRYKATADDAAYATFQLDGGVIAHFNSSWVTRVRRDDLLTLHVDGTHGSAVAGLQDVVTQQRMATPKPVWNPDIKQTIDFHAGWQPVPETQAFDNGFKLQ